MQYINYLIKKKNIYILFVLLINPIDKIILQIDILIFKFKTFFF